MYTMNSHKEYLANKVKTASPVELIVILCDATVSFLEAAKGCWVERDMIGATERIIKAQRCIREFKQSLNLKDGKEIAENLLGLYQFMDRSLTMASVSKETAPVDRVIRMLQGLRESWAEIAKKQVPEAVMTQSQLVGASYINIYK